MLRAVCTTLGQPDAPRWCAVIPERGIARHRLARTNVIVLTASTGHKEAMKPQAASTLVTSDDRFAAALRGFGPLGILAMIVILFAGNVSVGIVAVPVGAVLALMWARWSRTPWREIGYVRPRTWIGGLAIGLVFGCAFKLLMKAIVMPLLGAPAINQTYHYLAGNRA